ncbi:Peptidoglycan endopeptidase RipA precursor [Nonomuraea coxensis DSM 45129]|uniref:Peptidoglycan endopeptidase RipA n=1 Tax=Nonomuraea coxensis DSM 45129 TaxID=1122611 RepID=A0ABX8UDA0_9ACTN|nr:NlpC/P60 family protein [Nonomuraea coxensis]QYC45760.1 Peptidoglycan endopeptidase RipA precursor [Nonomuraea coxensis DSM 45129]
MRTIQAALLASCLLVALCPPAHPEPRPSTHDVRKARQAVRERSRALATTSARLATAQSRLATLAADVERLVEAYNGQLVRLRAAEEKARQTEARLTAADAEVERARQPVALLAAEAYGGLGPMGPILGLLTDHGDDEGALHRAGLLGRLSDERAAMLARLRDAQQVAAILRTQAAEARAEQQAMTERVREAKEAAGAAVASQRRETRALRVREHRLQRRVDAARTRADLLARRRAWAASAAGLITGGSAMGDVAADWALTQLGKPYVWAADGPATFDCSGLTMRAWERAGVALDHWTGTQWTAGPHVPLDQLRRGDLLFFAHVTSDPGTIHHVGIYVGRGLMVHAPQTGDVVRVASIWRGDLVGATRPL